MDNRTLRAENARYRGSNGVSKNNRCHGFVPAFKDTQTGQIEISRLKNGQPAPVHLIDWLPRELALEVCDDGMVQSLRPEVISGFVKDDVFYTREELLERA